MMKQEKRSSSIVAQEILASLIENKGANSGVKVWWL